MVRSSPVALYRVTRPSSMLAPVYPIHVAGSVRSSSVMSIMTPPLIVACALCRWTATWLPARTVAEPDASTVAEPDASTVAEPYASTVAEPDASTVAEPYARTVAEPYASTVAEPDARTVAEPDASTVAEPYARTVAEPDARTVAEPYASTVAESYASTVAEPDASTVAEPDASTVAEPDARTVAEPDAPRAVDQYRGNGGVAERSVQFGLGADGSCAGRLLHQNAPVLVVGLAVPAARLLFVRCPQPASESRFVATPAAATCGRLSRRGGVRTFAGLCVDDGAHLGANGVELAEDGQPADGHGGDGEGE